MVVCDQKKYIPVALALEDFSSGRFCLIGGAVDGVSLELVSCQTVLFVYLLASPGDWAAFNASSV